MTLEANQEEDLVAAMAAGDAAALDRLYTLYAPLALGLAVRMLGDRRSAEEAVQDAFLQVWRHAGSYTAERGSLRTWLMSIVRRRCIDRLRSSAVRPQTVAWEASYPEPGEESDPADQMERRRVGALLRGAVQCLPAKQREAIELAFFHERSHSEIADHLGIPLGTVKGRIRLGLSRLRDSLAHEPSLWPQLETRLQ
jgi:RNA polymerase sigma-70 factor, ECF subfamily